MINCLHEYGTCLCITFLLEDHIPSVAGLDANCFDGEETSRAMEPTGADLYPHLLVGVVPEFTVFNMAC